MANETDTANCQHDYQSLGLQWWDDKRLRPGSGATTIRYVNAFFCRHCVAKVFEATGMEHDSYGKHAAGSTPVSNRDWVAASNAR